MEVAIEVEVEATQTEIVELSAECLSMVGGGVLSVDY